MIGSQPSHPTRAYILNSGAEDNTSRVMDFIQCLCSVFFQWMSSLYLTRKRVQVSCITAFKLFFLPSDSTKLHELAMFSSPFFSPLCMKVFSTSC